jgi:DNA invertase Pin-like site-specific DNA recombinase
MRDARKRRFQVVLVARFDRFARSTKHLITALEEFQAQAVDFVSINENIDTSTPMGRMVFIIIAAVAQLERSLIQERVQAGVDRARRQGKQLGRPRVIVDRERVQNMAKEGLSTRSIAKQVGFSRSVIASILCYAENPSAVAKSPC